MLNAIKNRPLLNIVLSFFAGMILSSFLIFGVKVAIVILLFIVASVIIFHRRPLLGKMRRIAVLLPTIIGIIFGILFSYIAIEKPKSEITALNSSQKQITATVEEVTYRADYFVSYTVKVTELDGIKDSFSCALSLPYDLGAEENDVIRLQVIFSLPEKESYGFPLREYYSSRGIYILAEAADEKAEIISVDNSLLSKFRSISHDISVIFKTAFGNHNGGFVSGLLIGRKSDIPDDINTAYRYLGISHILSVSGLHLSILAGTFMLILRTLTVRRGIRNLLTFVFIILFILLTGAKPSVLRSGIMLIMLLFSEASGRDYDPITSLSFAALVIILLSPSAIYDAGFILSISATAGIILLGAPLTRWFYHISKSKGFFIKLLTGLLTPFVITASATILSLPAIWYFFGETSSVALLTNIIFIPLNTALMYLSLIFLIFYKTPLSSSFAGMASSLAQFITELASFCMKIMPEPIDLTYPFTVLALIITLCVLIYFLIKNRTALALILSVAAFAASYSACLIYYNRLHKDEENIIFASVKSNDYVIVNAEGNTLLCDFSNGSYSSSRHAFELVQPELHDPSVDTVLLTHLHRRHIEMISRLSDNNRIRQLFIPSPQSDDEKLFAKAIADAAEARGIEVIIFDSADDTTFDFHGIKITLHQKSYIKRSVQPLHLMMIDGKRNYLYIGGSVFESDIAESAFIALKKADVLFLGVHGPLIKKPLPVLNFSGEIVVSNEETNKAYSTNFEYVSFFKRYITAYKK